MMAYRHVQTHTAMAQHNKPVILIARNADRASRQPSTVLRWLAVLMVGSAFLALLLAMPSD